MKIAKRCVLSLLIPLSLFSILLWQGRAFSQVTSTTNGVNYLKTTQQADGSWGATPASLNGVFPTTATALEALRTVEGTASMNQTSAIAFLSAQSVAETPFLAQRVTALSGVGSTSADVDVLLARQNEDGGWGADEGCQSDSLDTSLALLALRVANVNAPAVFRSGVSYLSTTQNLDGGWSLTPGEDSQIFYTAFALQALDSLRLQFGTILFQQRALTYLRNGQNADGGYGGALLTPASTAFETSLSLLAIFGAGQPLTAAEARAINYLNSTQQANGSWADDAYSTALALRAISYPQDTDADGMSDECETANNLNPNNPSDATLDNDGDGLMNLEECRRRCVNPNNADTDGDTLNDGDEVANGSDPCDATSRNRAPVINSQPVTTASEAESYSYQVQASDADNDPLTYTLLRAPNGMSVSAAGLISWTPAANQAGIFTVIVKVSDGRGGMALQQYRLTALAQGVDLTVSSVDISQMTVDAPTLIATGSVRVSMRNVGGSSFEGSYEVLLFEDRNGNGTYQNATDTALGTGTFAGGIDSNAETSLNVRVSGVVLFRDNLVYAWSDSGEQIPELNENNNTGHSGLSSRFAPPAGDFQAKVRWQYNPPGGIVFDAPVVAPFIDTNGDGLVNERDVPAVINWIRGTNQLTALRGDTGAIIFQVTPPRGAFGAAVSPTVGDIDDDGVPELIIAAGGFAGGGLDCLNNDGTLRWSTPGESRDGSLTLADLDADGKSEILYGTSAFNFDGTLRWRTTQLPGYVGGNSNSSSRQVADLDGAGGPEVIAGASALDRDGNNIWSWQTFDNGTAIGVLDRGATTVTFLSEFQLSDAFTAVANLDDDPQPEVIAISNTADVSLWIFEHDGRLKTGRPIGLHRRVVNQITYSSSPPTVADFDGDGQPEIAIATFRNVSGTEPNAANHNQQILDVYRADGSLRWRRELSVGPSPGVNGIPPASAFDFDGDGAAELVYMDDVKLYILDGRDGTSLYELGINLNSSGIVRYPVIADADNDGSADIIAPTYSAFASTAAPRSGLLMLSDVKGHWRNARRVWNQWLYHVTNVEEDGGIPRVQRRDWQTFNNSRTQVSIDNLEPLSAPDLTVSKVTINTQNCPAGVGITARVGNGGSLHVAAGLSVNFYLGDPAAGGVLLGTRPTTIALYPGEFEEVTLSGVAPPIGQVFAVVHEATPPNLIASPNLSRLPDAWAQASGYLTRSVAVPANFRAYFGIDGIIGSNWVEDNFDSPLFFRLTEPFYEVRFPVPVNPTSVTITNSLSSIRGFTAGTFSFSNGFSVPANLNASGEGTTSFPEQQNVEWIRLTAASFIGNGGSITEFIVPGSYADIPFRIQEGSGRSGNNKAASVNFTAPCDTSVNQPPTIVSAPVINASTGAAYSYQVQAVDPNNDPLTFSLVTAPTGMSISTAGLVNWSPTDAQTGNVPVSVQVSDNRSGSAEQSFIITVTAPGGNLSPVFTSTPPAFIAQGQTLLHDVTATDADGDEVIFTLRQAPAGATLDQFSGHLLWTPTSTHTARQFFTVVAEDGRGGTSLQSFAVEVRAEVNIQPPEDRDGDGYFVPEDCDDTNPNINPGRVEIPGNGIDDDCNPETPDALPPNALTCSLVSDKRSYDSNSLAQLTAGVRNSSTNATAAGLLARVTVTDAAGQDVLDSTLPLNNLAPQAASRSVVPFNTQARTPGQYQAAVTLRYGTNTVCQAQATFSVLPSGTQGTALTGTITATPAVVNRGQTATLAYQVTNVGNVDLAALNLNLLIVSVNDGTVAQTFTEQATLNRGQAFNNTRSLNTTGMNTGEYLLVLRGETGGTTQTVASAGFRINVSSLEFSAANYNVAENAGIVQVTVQRTGDTSAAATVDYQTTDDKASERSDHTTSLGTLRFAANEVSRTFDVLVNDDSFAELSESLNLTLSNPVGAGLGSQSAATLTLTDSGRTGVNPLDQDAEFFVRQHYHDFLNREPDAAGLQFWTNQITQCGTDAQCIEIKRINVSAAFFLSIEFQETGYLVHRTYRAAYGRLPRYREFLRDSQEIGRGVVVGQGDWVEQIEANKQAFAHVFVARASFLTQYPLAMIPGQFVDALNANTGGSLTQAERDQLVADLAAGVKTRAQVLRAVAENSAFNRSEFNRAFVYMQYVGYLRRNPDDAPDNNLDGLNFWLAKLNQFGGNFIEAEMVKAFLVSGEYRGRFGQP